MLVNVLSLHETAVMLVHIMVHALHVHLVLVILLPDVQATIVLPPVEGAAYDAVETRRFHVRVPVHQTEDHVAESLVHIPVLYFLVAIQSLLDGVQLERS